MVRKPRARRAQRGVVAAIAIAVAVARCGPGPGVTPGDAQAPTDARVPPRCTPDGGVSRSPASIAEAVALINALPRPVTVECYLESLARPLRVTATDSVISLQPARGTRSPRLFFFEGRLVSSVVPDGEGRDLLEFGEFVDETQTLKAEVAFPLTGPLDPTEPYRRVRDRNPNLGTVCGGCHRMERAAGTPGLEGAFVSAALRPVPESRISLDYVRYEQQICNAASEPARCAFLQALFGHGDVVPWEFPRALPTIFY